MTRRTKDIALAQAGPALRDYEEWVLTFWGERRRANGAFPFYGPGVGKVSRPMATELRDLFICTVGLSGEVGELQEVIKKLVRDGRFDHEHLTHELGDVLYYLTVIARGFGLTLADVAAANRKKLEARRRAKP